MARITNALCGGTQPAAEGLSNVDYGLAVAARTGERFWRPELLRLRGELQHAQHPNCSYKWLQWISTPKVQAEQALSFEETPANAKACPYMNKMQKGSCTKYHLNAPASYFKSIKFWKTPVANCGNGKNNCMDYTKWQQAWTQLKG